MNLLDSIFSTATDSTMTVSGLLIAMATAFMLGLIISLVYMYTHRKQGPSQSFALTLVLLPAVVTVIILLVGNNVARAFSLAGAFTIIRFRSAPGEAKDITYVLMCMAVGLAAGMGYVLYAAIVALSLALVMLVLEAVKFGEQKGSPKLLKITIPENLDYEHAFDDILAKYTLNSTLRKVKTAELGSLYELSYSVTTKDDLSEKAFIDELRCRNGNLKISLLLDAPHSDF